MTELFYWGGREENNDKCFRRFFFFLMRGGMDSLTSKRLTKMLIISPFQHQISSSLKWRCWKRFPVWVLLALKFCASTTNRLYDYVVHIFKQKLAYRFNALAVSIQVVFYVYIITGRQFKDNLKFANSIKASN